MKFFAIIFSIYLLALSVMPCGDAYTVCQDNSAKTTLSQTHDRNLEGNDICSPFCTCTCCSTILALKITNHTVEAAKHPVLSKEKFPGRGFFFVSNFYANIWQPPKIS